MTSVVATLAAIGFLPLTTCAAAKGLDALRNDLATGAKKGTDFARVRKEFLLPADLTHLNTGSLGATPGFILDAVAGYLRELESDPVHNLFGPMGAAMEEVRRHAAQFIGADLAEVTITRNTTEGMNLIATGMKLKPGDEVLTTNHEHGGGLSCWQHLAERDGVKIVQIKMPAPAPDKQTILDLVAAAITPRTRVCSVSHVETVTGLQMPLKEIAQITRPKDILLVADGAQAPGMLDVDVSALGVDAYASSSHKWMLAPKGSGLLFIRAAAQDRIRPVSLRAGYSVYSASGGTRNVPHILGHGLAMDFHDTIGRDRVEQRCRQLQQHMRAHVETIPNLKILTPSDPALSGGILTFALRKARSAAVADQLFKEHRIIVKVLPPTLIVDPTITAEDYNAIRISTHVFNSEAQIDQTAEALRELAA